MAILKRINKFQGLKDIDIFEEESGLSSRFFQVFDFPTALPQGKSSFLIAGSPFLKNNVELKIEILDAGGNTIYTEPVPNYLEGQARRVSIEIYDDVVPGDGVMYLVGELKTNYKSFGGQEVNQDEVTGNIFDPASFGAFGAGNVPEEFVEQVNQFNNQDVPSEFQDVYNVRYSRPIFINPVIPNEQPIFFYKQPTVSVSEIVKPFIIPSGDIEPVILSGSVGVNPAPDLPPPPADIVPVDEGYPAISAKDIDLLGQQIEKFKNSKKAKINPFQNQSFRSRGRLIRRASPEVDRFTIEVNDVEGGSENDAGAISSAFVGSSITIKNPKVDNVKYPTEKFDIPTSYVTSIKKVNNNTTMVPEDDFLLTDKLSGEKIPVPIITGGTDTSNMEVTMSYTPQPTSSLSETHFRSFAKVTTANLRTFSGDVFKAKVYAKSEGSLGDFEPMWEGPIESPQLLVDPFSDTGFVNIGYFHKKEVFQDHWVSGSNTIITRDDNQIIDGIQISGSNYADGSNLTFTTSGSFDLETNVPYTIQFNTYFYKELAEDKEGNDETNFECEVQVSTLGLTENGSVDEYQTLGKINIDDFQNVNEARIDSVFSTFVSSTLGDPKVKVRFKLNKGRAIISDVVLRPYSETNFNPDYFECIIPLPYPLPKRPDNYDFLVEFYDVNNNLAETFSIKEKVPFVGPTPVIADGLDAVFSGSMLIGESMEMYGVNPAYLRSVGYRGFQHSIDNNLGGFMIFSGSVDSRISASEASGFEYNGGVGLEIVDAGGSTDRYMRFRTQPSIFEVVTDTFLLGSDSQFVSGSNGNIEISSSNFHLTPAGDVTMAGTINATAGNIGDFTIVGGQISGSNITFNADNSTIFKTDQGPGSDPQSSGFESQADEYYIDFTPLGESPDNYYIKMGPNFMVDKDGILIASGATFEGSITASSGLIGGFTTDSHSFSSEQIFISGSPKQGGIDSDEYMFISTSNFNVKQNGDVTGSSFLLEGGTITDGVTILGSVSANSILTPATIGGSPSTVSNASSSIDSQGFAAFRSASIGGWVVDPNRFLDPNNQVEIRSDSGSIALGTTIPDDLVSNGIFITGSGEFNFQVDSNNFIRNRTSDGFKLKTQDLNIDTSTLDLSTDNGGTIKLGSSPSLSANGIFLSGSGEFNFQSDANNLIKQSGGTFEIKAQTFDLATSTLVIDSATSSGKIALGATPNTSVDGTNQGIYLDGTGDFLARGNASNFLKMDGTAMTIKAGTFDLDATSIIMDSSGDSGNGVIRLGGSGGPDSPTANTAGIYMDGGGALNVYGDANNFFRIDGGSFTIASDTFDLDAGTIIMDSATSNGKIALGQTPPTSYSSGNGFYVDGDGKFLIGSGSGGDRLQFGNGQFVIELSSGFELNANNIEISSQQASMSLGEGNIILDGSNNKIKIGKDNTKQIEIVGNATQGYIATGKNSATSTTAGFWLANNNTDPEFHVGNASNFLKFDGGDFSLASEKLEVSASTIQISTTEASMSLGHNAGNPYGRIILQGSGTPKLAIGPDAEQLSLIAGSGIFMDGDGNFKFGDSDGNITFDGGNFSITGSDVDIQVTDLNITSTGFKLSSTEASMSLGTNEDFFMRANGASPFLSIGQSTKAYEQTGLFLGMVSSSPKVSFVGSQGHFKFDTDVDIATRNFELNANNIEISSTEASMSIGEGAIRLLGGDSKILVGGTADSNKQLTIVGGAQDNFIAMGGKSSFSNEGSGTSGIIIGMDATNPQAEFVKSADNYFIFDGGSGVDIKTTTFEMDANSGDLQISSAEKSMSLNGEVVLDGTNSRIEVGSGNKIKIQGGATDNFIVMGTKSTFSDEGSGTAGILIGMDGSNPQAEFVKGASDYFIFDNGVDIKTTKLELDAGSLQLSNTQNSMSLSPDGSNPIRMVGDGTDAFIAMGGKSSFGNEGSGTNGIIIGMDGSNAQAEFVASSTNYLIFDGGIDIKTDTFKLDTARLDIDSSTARINVFDLQGDEVVRIGELTGTNTFGMKVFDGSGDTDADATLVKLGGDGNEIAGWTITNDALTGGSMIIRQDGTIESAGFASNVAGSGFRLTAANGGFLEVENAKIRGTMSTTVFEKESVNAVGGQLYVANSTTIKSGSIVVATDTTMSVDNASGFSQNEVLSVKKVDTTGFSTEYMLVESASLNNQASLTDFSGKLFVQRGYSGSAPAGQDSGSLGDIASTATFYSGSQVIVSTGKIGTGYIRLNANPNDPTTPYIDIVERSGSAIYDVELKARLGDLSGLSSGLLFGNTNPGFGLFTENVFLQGAITATTGSITGILHVDTSDTQKLSIGKDVSGTEDGIHINDVNYWYTTGNFKVGDSAGNFVSSSGEISTDKLEINAGSGDFVLSTSNASMSFADEDILIKKDGSDASITVGGTASKSIKLLGSNTQGYIASGKSSVSDSTSGFWLANNNTTQEFHIGDATSGIKYDGSNVHITSSKFELDVNEGDLQISSQHKSASYGDRSIVIDGSTTSPTITLGSTSNKQITIKGTSSTAEIFSGKTSAASTTEGFWLANNNQDIEFAVGDATDFIKFDDNALSFAARSFELDAGDGDVQISSTQSSMSLAQGVIELDGGTTNVGKIKLGLTDTKNLQLTGSTTQGIIRSGKDSVNSTTAGIWIANNNTTQEFAIGDASQFIKFDSGTGNLDIQSDSIEITASNVDITTGTMFIDADDFQINSQVPSMSLGYDTTANAGITLLGGSTSQILFGEKASPEMNLSSNGTDAFLQVGSVTFDSGTDNAGIIIGSDNGVAELHLVTDVNKYFKYDGNELDIRTTKFRVNTGGGFDISGTSGTGTSNFLKLGSATSETAGEGIYMDGGGNFRVGTATSGTSYIYYDADTDAIDIKSDTFNLDTTTLDISALGTNKTSRISMGASPPTDFSSNGIIISGSGYFNFQKDESNYIKHTSSGFDIKAANFDLDAGTIIMDSSGTGIIKLGTSATSITETANTGIFMDGGGKFRVGTATNSTDYLHFDGSNIDIKTQALKLDTSNLDIDSAAGGSGSIALGTTPPTSAQSGNGFFVDGSGNILIGNSAASHIKFNKSSGVLEVTGTININNFDSDFGSQISGSSDALSGSFSDEVDSLQAGSSSMQTQVVLSSAGMALKNAAADKILANYGATTTIGETGFEHVEITNSSLKLKDDTTELVSISGTTVVVGSDTDNRITITPTSMQIGSVANGITMDANGDATFNGAITVTGTDIQGLTGSLDSDIDALQAGSSSMQTQVVLTGDGMDLKNAAGNVTVASYGTTSTIGIDADNQSRIFIDSDSVDLIVDDSGTDSVEASFGATSTIGNTAGQHISIDSDSFDVKSNSSTTLATFGSTTTIGLTNAENVLINGSGLSVRDNGVTLANFGSSMIVGKSATDKSALRVDSSGNITIGTSNTTNMTITAAGAVTMSGEITAAGGSIGGWSIGTDTISGGNTTLNDNGTITLGSSANANVNGVSQGIYMDAGGDFLVFGDNQNFIRFDVSSGLKLASENFELLASQLTASADDSFIKLGDEIKTTGGEWSGSDGAFISGSGEFSFRSGSQFIQAVNEGSNRGLQMNFGNFSVDTSGNMAASNATFAGDISATSGFFGSASNAGWILDETAIRDSDSQVVIDGGRGDDNSFPAKIALNSGSFSAEIIPTFTPANVVLKSGGSAYNAPDTQTIDNDSGLNVTSQTVSSGQSTTDIDAYVKAIGPDASGSNGIDVNTSDSGTSPKLTGAGTKYQHSLTFSFRIRTEDPGLSSITITSGYVSGGATYTLEVGLFDKTNGSYVAGTNTTINGSFFTDWDYEFDLQGTAPNQYFQTARTLTRTAESTTAQDDHLFEWRIIDASATNNNLVLNYQYALGGGNSKAGTKALDIEESRINITKVKHQPSNKVVELSPKGFQAVFLGESDLENAANKYFRVTPDEEKTIDILGEAVVTGSLKVRGRSTTDTTTIGSDIATTGHIETDEYFKSSTGGSGGYRFENSAAIEYDSSRMQFHVGSVSSEDAYIDASGNFHAKADIVGFSATVSDIQFKENVNPIQDALFKVKQLKGVEFDWKQDYNNKGHDIGFIAQEVEGVKGLEPFVSEHNNIVTNKPSKVVHYNKVVALLVEAVKEQQSQIEELKSEVEELRDGSTR